MPEPDDKPMTMTAFPEPTRQAVAFRAWTRLLDIPDVRIYVEVDQTVHGGIVITARSTGERLISEIVARAGAGPDELADLHPWPAAQRMPVAIVGGRPQPWHHQAIAEYDQAHGTTTEPKSTIPGSYTAAQVNQAISWWNERAEGLT